MKKVDKKVLLWIYECIILELNMIDMKVIVIFIVVLKKNLKYNLYRLILIFNDIYLVFF